MRVYEYDEGELEEALEATPYVFVYGTLKRGFGNHRVLGNSTFITEGVTEDNIKMVGSGVPYAYFGGEHPILGEVYKVNDTDSLESLDYLEGHPYFYCRKQVTINPTDGSAPLNCWMYLIRRTPVDYPFLIETPSGHVQSFR